MYRISLSERLISQLARVGIATHADLVGRQADLERLGFTALDARRVRFALLREAVGAAAGDADSVTPVPVDPCARLPELLTAREAADFLRVNRRTVANWCLAGTIAAYRLGDDWRIARAEVLKLLELPRETGV